MGDVLCLNRVFRIMTNRGYLTLLMQIVFVVIIKSEVKEYCSSEDFTPRCASDEVIVIEHAVYGRMRKGKCLGSTAGLGCQTDVLDILDSMCSNKDSCEVRVHSHLRTARNSCPKDMLRYLEADYTCKKVLRIQHTQCLSHANKIDVATPIAISSDQLSNVGCGSSSLQFSSRPGQKLNISLVDLTWSKSHLNTRSCINYFELTDTLASKSLPVCAGAERKRHVMTTNGSEVKVVFHIQDPQNQRFILELEAVGCGDISPPEGTWMQRDGDETTLGCHSGKHTWTLTCQYNQWVGAVGSCGTGGFVVPQKTVTQSDEKSWSIAPGMVVFASCSMILLIASSMFTISVCLCTKRLSKNKKTSYNQHQQLVHAQPLMQHMWHPEQTMFSQKQRQNYPTINSQNQPSFPKDVTLQNKRLPITENEQEYINTTNSQTDSMYSDSVKYFVLENINER